MVTPPRQLTLATIIIHPPRRPITPPTTKRHRVDNHGTKEENNYPQSEPYGLEKKAAHQIPTAANPTPPTTSTRPTSEVRSPPPKKITEKTAKVTNPSPPSPLPGDLLSPLNRGRHSNFAKRLNEHPRKTRITL